MYRGRNSRNCWRSGAVSIKPLWDKGCNCDTGDGAVAYCATCDGAVVIGALAKHGFGTDYGHQRRLGKRLHPLEVFAPTSTYLFMHGHWPVEAAKQG